VHKRAQKAPVRRNPPKSAASKRAPAQAGRTLARRNAPKIAVATRMYAAARKTRLTAGWQTSNTSADSELATSLTELRSRSRALVRDAAYPKRAKVIVVNNVVGPGIGMQAQVKTTRDDLSTRVNDAIEEAFADWCCAENCHTGGGLHFADLERVAMGQVFEAGEVFIRKHYRAFGRSSVPFALEVVEAERLADELASHGLPGPVAPGAHIRMGVEVDNFYRPLAYWIRERHPSEFRFGGNMTDRYERVPAEQILHLRIVDRWPQTRGEPWLHAVVRKLNDMDGLSEAEITAARGAASYMAAIETPDSKTPLAEAKPDGTREIPIEPGISVHLQPGEKFNFIAPNRPNAALDPFMRMMLREVAAGSMVSYESLSRDYSQSNYSSSRLALLDDRDLWRMLQQWFIRSCRAPLHREWLQQAVLARAVQAIPVEEYATEPKKFEAARFKPRGWSWIDPTSEVDAYAKAVRNGFTTVADVIASTADGRDIEDVLEGRRKELDDMAEKDLEFDTDPERDAKGGQANPPVPAKVEPPAPPAKVEDEEEDPAEKAERMLRALGQVVAGAVEAVGGVVADALRSQKPPQTLSTINNYVEPAAPAAVHIAPAAITVNTPEVRIENKVEVPAPVVNVPAAEVRIENKVDVPATVVNVPPAEVRIENRVDVPATVVNLPATEVNVAAPEVRINNRVEVAHETETVTQHKRDDRGELLESRARTKVVK
jgi:lambda family phage portal protein